MRVPQTSRLLRLLERLGSCRTDVEFDAALAGAFDSFGCEWFVHTVLPHSHLRLDEALGRARLPSGWYETYRDADLARSDPVMRHCRLSSDALDWSRFDPKRWTVMGRARDHGMRHGFTVPIHGAGGYAACLSMSGGAALDADAKPALHLVAMYAGERERSSGRKPARARSLTSRKAEVLTWAALGKSNADTAEILGISARTVTAHMVNAVDKPGAANKTQAVVHAMQHGSIAS